MSLRSVLNPLSWVNQSSLLVHLHASDASVIDALTGVEVNAAGKKDTALIKASVHKSALTDEFNWQGAVEALALKLALIDAKPRTSIRIVLSSDFVRYLLLPAQVVTLSHAEKNAYAKAAFRQLHGPKADDWLISVDNAAPNQATMLAAIDQQLHLNLLQITASHDLKLVSLSPFLMQIVNGLQKQLKHFTGYLALVEGSRIILLNIKDAQINQLKSQFITNDWQIELNQFLDREQTLGHANSTDMIICAPYHQARSAFTKKGWNIDSVEQNHQHFNFMPKLNSSHLELMS